MHPFPYFSMQKLTRLLIASSLFIGTAGTGFAADAAFSQKAFTDVKSTDVSFEAIEYLRSNNVIKGYLDGTFQPDRRLSRAEFVKFITNPFILDTTRINDCVPAETTEDSTTVFFPDVAKDAWYATEVCFAKTKRIIDGYPDGMFRPNHTINFVEGAKILSNVFTLEVENEAPGAYWYRPYTQRLSDLHAIPTSITRLDKPLTRREMAEIIFRLKTDKTNASYTNAADLN